ncbi:MAG: hypothetical protein FWD60_03205 [Candidatus Azobacteroides sp.]|nr:hypothetical protein [Candidatus Azobacteroides sp.]
MKKQLFLLCVAVAIASCEKAPLPVTDFEKSTVTDCEGNEYATVKLGNQWWMAENMKCTTYDSESRKAGNTIVSNVASITYLPYCFKITQTTIYAPGGVNYSAYLTNDQRAKIGYLYNWAAALGLNDGQVDTVFVEKQQGICPNGWHIPSGEEWATVIDYIKNESDGRFKTATGWFQNNDSTKSDPAFAVLPAGYAQGSRYIRSLGFSANFLSSTGSDIRSVVSRRFSCSDDVVMTYNEVKNYATSVRCVKDN